MFNLIPYWIIHLKKATVSTVAFVFNYSTRVVQINRDFYPIYIHQDKNQYLNTFFHLQSKKIEVFHILLSSNIPTQSINRDLVYLLYQHNPEYDARITREVSSLPAYPNPKIYYLWGLYCKSWKIWYCILSKMWLQIY